MVETGAISGEVAEETAEGRVVAMGEAKGGAAMEVAMEAGAMVAWEAMGAAAVVVGLVVTKVLEAVSRAA